MEMYYDEDLDEYEDDGEEQDQEVEEEYEEEQKDPKPTKEELEYLEMRQRLKEAARRKMKKENGVSFSSSQEKKKKLPYDNFGSFFGPSQPVIAQRVIQESKSLLENQHLAARISNSTTGVFADVKDARSAQLQPKSRQSMSGHSRVFSNGHEERKPAPTSRQIQSKTAHHQVASGSRRPSLTSAGSGEQIGSKITGIGPGRPTAPKGLPSKMTAAAKVPMSSKVSSLTADRKPYSVATKKPVAGVQKTPLSRLPSSVQHQHPEQRREVRRDVREPERAKIKSKMTAASSKPQNNLPRKTVSRPPTQVDRPKKKPSGPFDDDEEEDPSALIRKMFGYDPRKYNGIDEDDSDMEANFDDILKEERRSARIAHEEDERERLLIEEEEKRERLRKEAKRRKLPQQ